MVYALFYGLFTGIVLSGLLGTVFFSLVQNSLINGSKSGAWIALGVILSDTVLITLGYFSTSLFPKGGATETVVRIAGAAFLLALGINNLLSHKKIFFPKADNKQPVLLLSKGFMLNIINPANYMSWLAIAATVSNILQLSGGETWMFYSGALSGIFGTEMAISFGASRLKKYINDKLLHRFDMMLGVVFIGFSLLLLKPLLLK